jgi:hypothetical protein
VVEFWGPITAAVMINPQLGAVLDPSSVGVELPVLPNGAQALLNAVLIPNLMLAVPWLAGFLFAYIDDERQALHDHAARTRVVYELRRE